MSDHGALPSPPVSVDEDRHLWTLQGHLLRLVLLAALPVVLASIGLIFHLLNVQREALQQSLQDTVQAMSAAVDAKLAVSQALAESIAASPLIDAGDIPGLYQSALGAVQKYPGVRIGLVEPTGVQRFNTSRPVGSTLPNVLFPKRSGPSDGLGQARADDNIAQWKEAFSGAVPQFSNLFVSTLDQGYAVSYRAPAIREGVVRFVVTVAFAPEELHVLLRREGADDGWIASIVDRRGAIAARNVKPERFLGQQAPAAFLEATRGKEQGIERGVSLEGVPLMYAFSRSKVTGWTVAAGRPLSMAEAPLRTSFWVWLIVVGLLMMLGVHLARRLWVDIGLPLRALAENARALERGEPITLPPSRVREVRECSRAWEVALRAEKARRGQESLRLAAEARSRASELATREKDRLLAALSHELRNPLGAISNSVHVLEIAGPREGRVADMIAIIRRQTGHLGRLLDDLLDVARATFGKMSLLLEPLDLYLLVQQTLDAYRAGSGPMATLSLQGESVWVDADRTRLGQVVRNLIDNALKFTPAAGSIEVKVSGAGDLATLTVTDDGAGMPPELIEHLFGAFVQREQTIDRSQGGLGLGLALVRKIADLHYGTVTGESAGVGHGARFTFSLPRRAAPAAPDVRGVGSPIEAVPILVVEDRPDQRESLVHLLRIMGHEVRAAGDAAQARVMLQDWQPRLIFIDLGLPGEDGIEFARSLRAQSRHAQVRIVALTAYGGGDYSARLREVGFDGKLVKPSSHAELEQLVRALPPTD